MINETVVPTDWMPPLRAIVVVLFFCILGSILNAAFIGQDTEVGWAIWYFPIASLATALICLLAGVGALLAFNTVLSRSMLTGLSPLVATVIIAIVAYVFWHFSSEVIFRYVLYRLPATNLNALDLFHRGWLEFGSQYFVGSLFVTIMFAAVQQKPSVRHRIPVAAVTGLLGVAILLYALVRIVSAIIV